MTTAVAIALYNGSRFLEKQLDSIRLQTCAPDQVILCDDGSRDATVQIVRDYIARYSLEENWHIYENETNLGYIRNFYKAISLCTADCVFLSDQDDIWAHDKIEKMNAQMQRNQRISLLCCKYGIIDAQDNVQQSITEPEQIENHKVEEVTVADIMRAYRWPGMTMCLRKSFFQRIYPSIHDKNVAHDLMFAVCAADAGEFFSYNYVGAYHRRHDNNTAREEHRITKLLNLQRKLKDIEITKGTWAELSQANLPISNNNAEQISRRLALMDARLYALKTRSLTKILKLYCMDKSHYLRIGSFLCDLWLVCFGNYREVSRTSER